MMYMRSFMFQRLQTASQANCPVVSTYGTKRSAFLSTIAVTWPSTVLTAPTRRSAVSTHPPQYYYVQGAAEPIKQFWGIINTKSRYLEKKMLFSKLLVHTILYSFSFEYIVLKMAAVHFLKGSLKLWTVRRQIAGMEYTSLVNRSLSSGRVWEWRLNTFSFSIPKERIRKCSNLLTRRPPHITPQRD